MITRKNIEMKGGKGWKTDWSKAQTNTRLPSKYRSALWASKRNSYSLGRTQSDTWQVTLCQSWIAGLSRNISSPSQSKAWKPVTSKAVNSRLLWVVEVQKRLVMNETSWIDNDFYLLISVALIFRQPLITLDMKCLRSTQMNGWKSKFGDPVEKTMPSWNEI